jgi:hypothetical protein
MNSQAERHLNPERLLQFSDGELQGAERRAADGHLAECGDCRKRRDEIAEGLKAYLDYRAEVPTPAAWSDLRDGMAEIDARIACIRARRTPRTNPFRLWRWAAAGLVAAALLAAAYRYRQIPSVQAAGLLRKAVAAAGPPPAGARIRLHTKRRDLVRPAAVPQPGSDELAKLFANAGYDWNLPFSAQAFAAWRDRLPDKRDTVELRPKDAGAAAPVYLIRTTSASNSLTSTTLVLRASDYLPIRETLEFRENETVEITSAIPAPASTPAIPSAAPPAPRPATVRPLAVRQLRALVALHSIYADLGEVEISAAGGTLAIRSVGIDAARREQIRQALGSVDGVEVTLDDGGPAPPPKVRSGGAAKPVPEAPLRGLLASKLDSGASIDEALDRILDTSDAMLAQAFALHSLADRFPPAAEAALTDADRASLLQLRDDYSREFRRQFARLRQLLSPVAAVGGTDGREAGPWQDGAAAVLAAAKSLDSAVSACFASAAPTAPPDQMAHRLENSLREASAAAGGLP